MSEGNGTEFKCPLGSGEVVRRLDDAVDTVFQTYSLVESILEKAESLRMLQEISNRQNGINEKLTALLEKMVDGNLDRDKSHTEASKNMSANFHKMYLTVISALVVIIIYAFTGTTFDWIDALSKVFK